MNDRRLIETVDMSDNDRAAMGTRGRTLIGTTFSWSRIGQQMRAIYDWVLDGGAPPETIRLD